MPSMNRVTLMGNLGADPDMKRTQDGRPIANLRLATSENWRDKQSGERKERTEWHRVVCWNEGLCKVIEQYLAKGDTILIEGQLETRKWTDQSGADRYSTEVVMRPFNGTLKILKCKNFERNGGGRRDDDFGGGDRVPDNARGSRQNDMDDDIPF